MPLFEPLFPFLLPLVLLPLAEPLFLFEPLELLSTPLFEPLLLFPSLLFESSSLGLTFSQSLPLDELEGFLLFEPSSLIA